MRHSASMSYIDDLAQLYGNFRISNGFVEICTRLDIFVILGKAVNCLSALKQHQLICLLKVSWSSSLTPRILTLFLHKETAFTSNFSSIYTEDIGDDDVINEICLDLLSCYFRKASQKHSCNPVFGQIEYLPLRLDTKSKCY